VLNLLIILISKPTLIPVLKSAAVLPLILMLPLPLMVTLMSMLMSPLMVELMLMLTAIATQKHEKQSPGSNLIVDI
jgi:hypothetical protein